MGADAYIKEAAVLTLLTEDELGPAMEVLCEELDKWNLPLVNDMSQGVRSGRRADRLVNLIAWTRFILQDERGSLQAKQVRKLPLAVLDSCEGPAYAIVDALTGELGDDTEAWEKFAQSCAEGLLWKDAVDK